MNIITIILVAFAIEAYAFSDIPYKVCLEMEGVSPEDGLKITHAEILPNITEQTNEKLKCYAACMAEQMNIIDGCTYKLEESKQYAMENNIEELIHSLELCENSAQGNERCECGYNVFKCVTDNFMEEMAYLH